ncbi:hypothetical protein GCM10009795_015180 [Nocardioides hankookensis]|uniref:Glycosyltransferase RgtA/B/C/D-like domain-containing protein n=1 Tax=Nocardioides hankookensis TaxID=443157 RepID=A0ABW1LJ02_9ACTN
MTAAGFRRVSTTTLGTVVGLGIGGLAFFLSLLNYSRDLGRTASDPGYWSNLYDIQATALLNGHLSVPTGSLSIEGIVHDGHTYMYFPMFPALLRMPVQMVTHDFDGRLSLVSMALAWILFATMTTRLLWLVMRIVTQRETPGRKDAAFAAVFLAAATGGTTLTYDASLPWVYHEAYVWAAAAAVGAMYWMVRVLHDGEHLSVRWLGALVLLCVLTRPTEGIAAGLTAIAIAVYVASGRARAIDRRIWWQLALAGVLPLLVGVAISELKFDSVYMHPLTDQVWTTVNEHRREALAANGGSLTGVQFFPTSLVAYFGLGIRFVPWFPWITLPADPARAYGDVVIDQSYRTGSVTMFMSLLLLLTVLATVALLRRRTRAEERVLLFPLAAGVLLSGGVMAYGYYSFRYVTDFVPALVIGGAIGTAVVCRWATGRTTAAKVLLAAGTAATAFAIAAHLAVGYATAAVAAAGDDLVRYVDLQATLSGGSLGEMVHHDTDIPADGPTDELLVLDDCASLYLNTGDAYRPWATVAARDLNFVIDPTGAPASGRIRLVDLTNGAWISLESSSRGQIRVILSRPDEPDIDGPWHDRSQGRLSIRIENDTALEYFRVYTDPGTQVGALLSVDHDADWYYRPVRLVPVLSAPLDADELGLTLLAGWGPAPAVCERVAGLGRDD